MLKIVKNSWKFAKIAKKENRCQTAGEKHPEKRKIIGKEIRKIGIAKKVSLESVCKTDRTYDFKIYMFKEKLQYLRVTHRF